jgi:hypothetical protein
MSAGMSDNSSSAERGIVTISGCGVLSGPSRLDSNVLVGSGIGVGVASLSFAACLDGSLYSARVDSISDVADSIRNSRWSAFCESPRFSR